MSTEIKRESLALEKLRQELRKMSEDMQTEYARRHNWEAQERHWRWQNWLLLGAFILGVLGLLLRVWP